MEYIYLGKLVNTHGIKGEVRIKSNFKYKDQVFKINNLLYIGKNKDELKITSYRVHKEFDMVTFEGINDINDVLKYKGENVYFDRDNININGILNEDLIGIEVYSNRFIGKVTDILESNAHQIIVIEKDGITNMVPFVDEFILNIDLENKKIIIKEIEGLIHED